MSANVDDPGSLAFAERFGFHEVDRQVEQVRAVEVEAAPSMPVGVEIVSVAQRPRLGYSTRTESISVRAPLPLRQSEASAA